MNKILKVASATILSLAASSAFAWPMCRDGTTSVIGEGSNNYVCPCGGGVFVTPTQSCPAPTPTPTPAPAPVTATGTGTSSSDADAAAAARADAEARAAAASISAALASGGNATGGNAQAANDIFVRLSPEMQTRVLSQLSQEQRQALSNVNENVNRLINNSPATATIGAGAGAGGGAQVATTNISNSSARTLVLAPITAQAPSLPHQMGSFSVQDGLCSPPLSYKPFEMPIVHRRAFLPDNVIGMDTGLMVVDSKQPKQDWIVLGVSEDGKFRVVQGEIARQVVGLNSVSGSDGMSIQFGNGNGAGGVGSSGGKANQFMAGYFMQPSVCYVKQTKLGAGWIPTDLIKVEVTTTATATPPAGPTADDVLRALAAARIVLNVPTSTVVRDNTPCKMEEFTDAAGKKVTMCRGPQGSYQTTRVVPGNVAATGTLELGVAGKK